MCFTYIHTHTQKEVKDNKQKTSEVRKMNKEQFKTIFDKCMSVKTANVFYDNGTPEGEIETFEIEPHCTIRDFEIDVSYMQETGIWDSSKTDTEFKDFDKAWAYFQEVFPNCRVIDGSGQIHYDFYSEVGK